MAINGFSTCNATARGAAFRVEGTTRYLQVRREIAPLLLGFAAEFHRLVEPIDRGTRDDWGYACRRVRGRTNVSFHAAGIAIDLGALKHPLGVRNTFTPRQRATIRVLCEKYGLRWGGDFNRPDEMHFEVILPRGEALALVKKLQAERDAEHAARTPRAVPRLPKIRFGADNSDVVLLQQRLAKLGFNPGSTDGIYGKKTRAAVSAFQKSLGWRGGVDQPGSDADGNVGPVTLDHLF